MYGRGSRAQWGSESDSEQLLHPTPISSCLMPTPISSCLLPTPSTSCLFPTPISSCLFPTPSSSCLFPTSHHQLNRYYRHRLGLQRPNAVPLRFAITQRNPPTSWREFHHHRLGHNGWQTQMWRCGTSGRLPTGGILVSWILTSGQIKNTNNVSKQRKKVFGPVHYLYSTCTPNFGCILASCRISFP
jgi:hypothetical protein